MSTEKQARFPNNSSRITRVFLTPSKNNNIQQPLKVYFFGATPNAPIPLFIIYGA